MALLTLAQLNKKLARLSRKYPAIAGQIRANVASAALKELVFRTPVDTGLARGSWRVTKTRPSQATPSKDRGGGRTVAQGLAAIRAFRNIQTDLFITNVSDHLELIDSGVIRITKARPFAAPGFVDNGIRAAQIEVGKQSVIAIAKQAGVR